jgi:hypothetical protein
MSKVFVEYRIVKGNRSSYIDYMQKVIKQTGLELFEGTDQPDLFVEIWSDVPYAAFESLKADRLAPKEGSIWLPLTSMIDGGSSKLHIWHFTGIAPDIETYKKS